MFTFLGAVVARCWPVLIGLWLLLLVATRWCAPPWDAVTGTGEIDFLPPDSPSRHSDELLQKAFPGESTGSSIVLAVHRDSEPLKTEDRRFIKETLVARLSEVATATSEEPSPVARVRTFADEGTGALLVSRDQHATLVVLELTTPFLDQRNVPMVAKVEEVLKDLHYRHELPEGLAIAITGSATAGRDLQAAEARTAQAVEMWTIVIVIALLILMYRAPLVALIPLCTVYVSTQIALHVLAMLAGAEVFTLSRDTRVFVTVLAYGAGVDYCLFLIARFREEQEQGATPTEAAAAATAVARVGAAIAASAATVIGGIAMLAFASFGKIHAAGLTIPIALAIVFCAALTFSAPLLCLTGRWTFWPNETGERRGVSPTWATSHHPGLLRRWLSVSWLPDLWAALARLLVRWPATIWLASVALLAPFAVIAVLCYDEQNYNPISDLPVSTPSTVGTRVVERHFPPGMLGTVTVLVYNDQVHFGKEKGIDQIASLTNQLRDHQEELDLLDIRSVAKPLGLSPAAQEYLNSMPRAMPQPPPSFLTPSKGALPFISMPRGVSYDAVLERKAIGFYVSHAPDVQGHVARLDLVLGTDPLSRAGIADLDRIEDFLQTHLPAELQGTELDFSGPTATVRDFAAVKHSDENRIGWLVPAVVFVLLVLLLRRVTISIYLVLSVLLSYFATLGLTYLLFAWLEGDSFAGLDWKVAIFLFTTLVAVGEDYNIFLVARIKEEQERHGRLEGITTALAKTGRVISNCGILMAGTFASLLSSDLLAMKELGFALAFGVMLDTLLVRPILVPTFLILLDSGRLGRLGQHLALTRPD